MDRTIVGSARAQVRGGSFSIVGADDGAEALQVGPEPRIIGRKPGCHLVLADRKVSATHCEVVATDRGVRLRDLGSSNGTYLGDFRVVEALLDRPAVIRCGDTELEFRPGDVERVTVSKSEQLGPLVGATPAMRALFQKLRIVAPTTVSVLVEGETGTGKELVAQAIHQTSERAGRPFVIVDCAAIPPNLAESTLFGHERGSFTGAERKRVSPFVEANGGTVFLDELGELPLDVQPKLLRVLAEQRVKSVGGDAYVPIDVRIVAATRRGLLQEINRGAFRDDLYFRIAQERVTMPPLRERADDIVPIVRHLMQQAGKGAAFKRVSAETLERLMRHDWPGNVRELRNVVTLALAYDRGTGAVPLADHIAANAVPSAPRGGRGSGGARPERTYAESKQEHDRAYFTALHRATDGNIKEMGRRADIARETVRTYMRALRIGSYGRDEAD
ncbi:MAG TPA: sigma 54-interacting transcriptional regulator [Polyangiaceae bacterium]